ncbi:MAG TPA: hypothetical protein VMB23_05905, partial [Spirochaetia bacterium]|nr:hypothetical protein [Spirochaetia bacterium]
MGRFPLRLALILVALGLVAVACKQPTSDPDQALRDLIVNKTWYPDTNYADTNTDIFFFQPGGTGYTHSGNWTFNWA